MIAKFINWLRKIKIMGIPLFFFWEESTNSSAFLDNKWTYLAHHYIVKSLD